MHLAWAGIDLDKFPKLKEWKEKLFERPGFLKGYNVPASKEVKKATLTKEEEEEAAKQASAWVMRGMKEDAAL